MRAPINVVRPLINRWRPLITVPTAHKRSATAHKLDASAHKRSATAHKLDASAHKPVPTAHKSSTTAHKPVPTAHKKSRDDIRTKKVDYLSQCETYFIIFITIFLLIKKEQHFAALFYHILIIVYGLVFLNLLQPPPS